jgi:YaiO family outer membrane protein
MLSDAPPAYVCMAPEDASQSLNRARAARLAGDYDRARCELDHAIAAEPDNADAFVEHGYLNATTGDSEAARYAFQRALALAPEHDDARFGLAQLAYRDGAFEVSRSWLDRIRAERQDDPEVVTLRRAVDRGDAPSTSWRWDAVAAYSALSEDLSPWREASLAVTRRSGDTSIGVAVERVQRFGLDDTYGEVRFARSDGRSTWGLAIGGAAAPHFRPEAAIRFEYASPERNGAAFDASLTIARYGVGQVDTLTVRARNQVGAKLELNARGILVLDEADAVRGGYGVGAAWQANDAALLDAAFVDAPESSEGVTVDVRTVVLGLATEVSSRLRVRVGVTHEQRDAFDRTELALSISRTF